MMGGDREGLNSGLPALGVELDHRVIVLVYEVLEILVSQDVHAVFLLRTCGI